jgi:hypothetical protein
MTGNDIPNNVEEALFRAVEEAVANRVQPKTFIRAAARMWEEVLLENVKTDRSLWDYILKEIK